MGTDPAANGELAYGAVRVSIPRDHRMGELEGPSIFKLEFSPDQTKHIVVVGRPLLGAQAAVFNQIRQDLKEGKEPTALVFVHGFATSFQDAARRTAQLSYDLGFTGIPVLYTWASKGSISPLAYNHDGRNAELTSVKFQQFLVSLAQQAGLKSVHVIAHSMGTRVVSKSLAELSRAQPRVAVQQVALFAPDIDADLFRQLSATMKTGARRITLYASSKDIALSASQRYATYPRAGQGGEGLVIVPGVDTIDASSVDTNPLAFFHGYYGDSRSVISDLFYTLRGLMPKDRQGLIARDKAGQTYWAFRP
ncbi:MAG: alpha/beta fold hydrolase [Paludibaculum sp.]